MSEPLKIKNLTHYYQTQPVFTGVDLTIKTGEFLAVLGPSGCGKSTLLRSIAGLTTPKQGTIALNEDYAVQEGQEKISVEKRKIGLVFQDYALFPQQTVKENITFGLHQWTKMEKENRAEELLFMMGLTPLAHRKPSELSGGQQQRVALARALAPKPQLLLLDEPFANVEANLRQTLGEELQILTKQENISVLLVTHDRAEAFALADRMAIMEPSNDGSRIVQCDTPEHIYHYPVSRTVAQMGGAVSFTAGEANGEVAETTLGRLSLVNPSQGKGMAVIRPEMAQFIPDAQGTAEIVARQFQGWGYRLLCITPSGKVFAQLTEREPPEIGEKGNINITESAWWLSL